MEYTNTRFEDLLILKNKFFQDDRGSLVKYFYSDFFINLDFRVDDIYTTVSNKDIIRGLHHQTGIYGQAKLVSCLSGSYVDVVVDLRENSTTYGEVFHYKLTAASKDALLIPPGFSHGTLSLENNTTMLSICSGKYLPEHEAGINIKSIDLPYDISMSIFSAKDLALPDIHSVISSHENRS